MFRFAVVLSLLLASGAAFAAPQTCDTATAPPVPAIKNLPYAQARPLLIAAHWAPAHGTQYADLSGNEGVFHDLGYTEVQFCALDVDAACRFEFVGPHGLVLRLTTMGAENTLLGTHAVVKKIEILCAPQ